MKDGRAEGDKVAKAIEELKQMMAKLWCNNSRW